MTVSIPQRFAALLAVFLLALLTCLGVAAATGSTLVTGSADSVAKPIDGPGSDVCRLIPGCENGG